MGLILLTIYGIDKPILEPTSPIIRRGILKMVPFKKQRYGRYPKARTECMDLNIHLLTSLMMKG
jgi:hypothetical protein